MRGSPLNIVVRKVDRQSLPKPGVVLTPVRTPAGVVVGEIILEGKNRVFVRRVRERDRYREQDAWPIGDFILRHLQRWKVAKIRYVAPDGVYEAPMRFFTANAIVLDFEHETQHVLPRVSWPVRPADQEITTPPEVTQADLLPHQSPGPDAEQTDLFGATP